MTDYEELRMFLGGDALATRAVQFLTTFGCDGSVKSLLSMYKEDPGFLRFQWRFGGHKTIARVTERCSVAWPELHPHGNLREFLGGDGLATRTATALVRSGIAYTADSLLNAYVEDPNCFDVRGLGPRSVDRIRERCGAHLPPFNA